MGLVRIVKIVAQQYAITAQKDADGEFPRWIGPFSHGLNKGFDIFMEMNIGPHANKYG